jgi:hypothetical protein
MKLINFFLISLFSALSLFAPSDLTRVQKQDKALKADSKDSVTAVPRAVSVQKTPLTGRRWVVLPIKDDEEDSGPE